MSAANGLYTYTNDTSPLIVSANGFTTARGRAPGFTVQATGYPAPTFSNTSPPGNIVLHDNGDGIPPEQLLHVFERFYRGDTARDRKDRGSGVGLTISRAIIDAHGGSLSATSPGPGLGSTFVVRLPLKGRAQE